jgi:alkaline phosphatase
MIANRKKCLLLVTKITIYMLIVFVCLIDYQNVQCHKSASRKSRSNSHDWSQDEDPARWSKLASQTLNDLLKRQVNNKIAKNLIMFLGDGMGINTINVK